MYLQGCITDLSVLSPLKRYLLVRDLTFFVVDFHTRDRASDLSDRSGFHLKDKDGFLVNFTCGITKLAGKARPFALLRMSHVPVFCSLAYVARTSLPSFLA